MNNQLMGEKIQKTVKQYKILKEHFSGFYILFKKHYEKNSFQFIKDVGDITDDSFQFTIFDNSNIFVCFSMRKATGSHHEYLGSISFNKTIKDTDNKKNFIFIYINTKGDYFFNLEDMDKKENQINISDADKNIDDQFYKEKIEVLFINIGKKYIEECVF